MALVEFRIFTQPVGIMRTIVAILTCLCFSLVASVGHFPSSYWAWCMFTWCFCFFFTFLILILEFTTVKTKLPFSWEDSTAAFAMLASLMCLATSIIYPTFFTCTTCHREIAASVVSWVCFGIYTGEVVFTRLRPSGETSGFLSTLPGIMKMIEAFIACLIFTSLENSQFNPPARQWCVAVYCLCFIFAIAIILLCHGRLTSFFPFPFERLMIVYNVLAAVMYITAMVIWPLYSFNSKYASNDNPIRSEWDKLVVVTFLTVLNCTVYIMDTIYSVCIVFFVSNQ